MITYKDFDDFRDNGKAGDICIMRLDGKISGLSYKYPGCGKESYLPLDDPRHWKIQSENPLTITPSVFDKQGCGWHGWLRSGKWVSV